MIKSFINCIRAISPHLTILLAALVLMSIWFADGKMLASSESALPFANLARYVELTANAWSNYALGNYPGFTAASWLTYVFFFGFAKLGLPDFLIEAIFFYIIFVASGIAIYELGKELFPETKDPFLYLGVIYYWFSPFALVNIWNRFLYNYMVFLAFFPLVIWLFIRGLRLKRYTYGFYIGIVSLIFSYASTSPPFDFLLWFILGGITLLNLIWLKKINDKFFAVKFLVFCLVIYFLFNLWWISQMFSYSVSENSSPSSNLFFNSIDNLDTIENISFRLGNLSDVVRLMHHDFYLNSSVPWIDFFSKSLALTFEFGILFLVLLVTGIKLKKRSVLICGIFLLLGFFLMKGSSPPLGELTLWLFATFPVLQLFRNPFEKFGFLLPVFLSPLISYSFYWIFQKTYLFKNLAYLLLIIFILFFGKPFLTKELFTYQDNAGVWKSYAVVVPDYYQHANSWLKSQPGNFRIVAFPLGGEGITYSWEFPFSGVESSNTLLDIPAISYNTTIPYYSDISSKMQEDFLYDPNFFQKAEILNIRYILLRTDINFRERQMLDPRVIADKIKFYEDKGVIVPVKKFGDLSFWEVLSWKDTTVISQNVVNTASPIQSFKLIDQQSDQSILVDAKTEASVPDSMINKKWILPNDQIVLDSVVSLGYERDQKVFPFVSHLPTDLVYPLVRIKEHLQIAVIFNQKRKMEAELFLLGKRISEMEMARNQKKWTAFEESALNYQNDFKEYIDEISKYSKNPDSQYQNWKSQHLYVFFSRHQNYFSEILSNPILGEKRQKMVSDLNWLVESELKKNYIIPLKTKLNQPSNGLDAWKIYKFSNLENKEYELVSSNKINLEVGTEIPYEFIVNGVSFQQKAIVRDDQRINLGLISLEKGINEIALKPIFINSLQNLSSMAVDLKESFLEISNYDPSSLFYLKFNYLLPEGSSLEMIKYGDNNVWKNGKQVGSPLLTLSSDLVHKNRVQTQVFYPGENTYQTRLGIKLNNPFCQQNEDPNYDCSETKLEKLTIDKYLQIEPVLVSAKSDILYTDQKIDNYTKISDSKYQIRMVNTDTPSILSLNQLYHPGWQLTVNGKKVTNHILVNSYANGWIIDQVGDLNAVIEFIPDNYYKLSQIISGMSVLFISIFGIYKWIKSNYGKN